MTRTIVTTDSAPAAVGPYSQAVKVGRFVFTAGQVALDPANGNLVAGDVSAQVEQALRNVEAVLAAAGAGLADVVKTTVFLKSMKDFAAMNEVYGRFFPESPPARTTIGVAALPRNALVEIETVARLPKPAAPSAGSAVGDKAKSKKKGKSGKRKGK